MLLSHYIEALEAQNKDKDARIEALEAQNKAKMLVLKL